MPRQPLSSVNENRRFISVTSQDETEPEVRCGIRNFRPEVLQKCNNPRIMILVMCIYVFMQGFVVSGITKVNVSTLERRFQLKSTHMGLVDSVYDFSAAIFGLVIRWYIAVHNAIRYDAKSTYMGMVDSVYDFSAAIFGLVISYIGSGRHKARLLSWSAVAMMFGSFIMVVPHFASGLYRWGEGESRTCDVRDNTTLSAKCTGSGLQNYFWVFMCGMTILGVGGATLYTVGTAYIDDSVPSTSSPFYLGIFSGCAAFGPSIGYIVGGFFLGIYVDFDVVDTQRIPIDDSDARWVGAWWIGPLLSIFLFIIPAVALACFGAELPAARLVRETRVSQRHGASSSKVTGTTPARPKIKELPQVALTLFKNPPFLFTTLAGITETMYLAGLTTFVSKYVQNVYNMSSKRAGIIAGIVGLLGFTGGITTGGIICRCMRLKVRGMLKLSLCACAVSMVGMFMTFARCGQTHVAGVHSGYFGSSNVSLVDTCNRACQCSTERFDISCDKAGNQFLSPCFAGCRQMEQDEKTFRDCSCVWPDPDSNSTTLRSGGCGSKCGLFYVFLVLLFLLLFCTMVAEVPAEQASLRSIDENHRTIMCGLSRFLGRMLGTVPGSIIMGAATDVGCRIWQKECGENASCWLYDNDVISRNYFVIGIVTKVCSMAFYFCALRFYKPPENVDVITEISLESPDTEMSNVFLDSTENNNIDHIDTGP